MPARTCPALSGRAGGDVPAISGGAGNRRRHRRTTCRRSDGIWRSSPRCAFRMRSKRPNVTAADRESFAAMRTLVKQGWGSNNPAFRQIFTSLMMPGATKDQMDAFNELQRLSASPECAVRYMEKGGQSRCARTLGSGEGADARHACSRRRYDAALRESDRIPARRSWDQEWLTLATGRRPSTFGRKIVSKPIVGRKEHTW